jgi:hypothetical protein
VEPQQRILRTAAQVEVVAVIPQRELQDPAPQAARAVQVTLGQSLVILMQVAVAVEDLQQAAQEDLV